jgi:site-specific DNA recombinase
MVEPLTFVGAASADICRQAYEHWLKCAREAGIDLAGFDPTATLETRIAWAHSRGLDIAAILARYSSKMQHSTLAQVLDDLEYGAKHLMYVPPELICVDEAVSGRKSRRDGLARMKTILGRKLADVLLVFKVSRLFRVAYLGFQFFQEEVVESGLRAVSISQGIDTADGQQWKLLAYMHGVMDEMLLTQIADHVRSGLRDLFRHGYVTGALGVGYRRVEVPGAMRTNRGLPRTMPAVDPAAKEVIVRALERIDQGISISRAHQLYVAEGGPCDPRSKLGYMSYTAFRRLISNPRLIGLWAFGRKRNGWSTKRDCSRQIEQPETEVILVRSEELRIIEDSLFYRVQASLAKHQGAPRGPKKKRRLELWDLLTECYLCEACSRDRGEDEAIRYYVAGAHGEAMRCKRGKLCSAPVLVKRKAAVLAVVEQLRKSLLQDEALLRQIDLEAIAFNGRDRSDIDRQIQDAEQQLRTLDRRIKILRNSAGRGDESADDGLAADIMSAVSERAALRSELEALRQDAERQTLTVTPEMVRQVLQTLPELLADGAAGRLGEDMIYRAARIVRELVGGRILVRTVPRPGRTRCCVQGVFRLRLLKTIRADLGLPSVATTADEETVVWLRPPPRCELLAERVHLLIDREGLSERGAAKLLQSEGHRISYAGVWQAYRRYYQMLGQLPPQRPYNNGHPRQPGDD